MYSIHFFNSFRSFCLLNIFAMACCYWIYFHKIFVYSFIHLAFSTPFLLLLLFSLFSFQITCSGLFELKLKSFRNDKGVNSLNRCCSEKQSINGLCLGSCKTRFRVCLKQYQAEVDTTSSCTFGSAATIILGDNTFNLTQSSIALKSQSQKDSRTNPIRFPFEFTWPVSIMSY